MDAYLQLIKRFVWSVLVFDYELSTDYDTDKKSLYPNLARCATCKIAAF